MLLLYFAHVDRPANEAPQAGGAKRTHPKTLNSSAVAQRQLPPATPCGSCVLTVHCRSPHPCARRPYDNPCFKMTMPTPVCSTSAPLGGCCHRMPRILHGIRLPQPVQSGAARLTRGRSYGWASTLGSRNARGPVAIVVPLSAHEHNVRLPALVSVRHRPSLSHEYLRV